MLMTSVIFYEFWYRFLIINLSYYLKCFDHVASTTSETQGRLSMAGRFGRPSISDTYRTTFIDFVDLCSDFRRLPCFFSTFFASYRFHSSAARIACCRFVFQRVLI